MPKLAVGDWVRFTNKYTISYDGLGDKLFLVTSVFEHPGCQSGICVHYAGEFGNRNWDSDWFELDKEAIFNKLIDEYYGISGE